MMSLFVSIFSRADMGFVTQLCLLLWKNFTLRKRQKVINNVKTILEQHILNFLPNTLSKHIKNNYEDFLYF